MCGFHLEIWPTSRGCFDTKLISDKGIYVPFSLLVVAALGVFRFFLRYSLFASATVFGCFHVGWWFDWKFLGRLFQPLQDLGEASLEAVHLRGEGGLPLFFFIEKNPGKATQENRGKPWLCLGKVVSWKLIR